MPRSEPITMMFPPFAGAVRRLVLANVAVFFAIAALEWLAPGPAQGLLGALVLRPAAVAHGAVWQLVTYAFVHLDLLDVLFAMLTLWFCGTMLEQAYGTRWMVELYFCSAVGGAGLATLAALAGMFRLGSHVAGYGAWAGLFGLLIAIAIRMGDTEFRMMLLVPIKARYMVAIYLLIALASVLKTGNAFGAALALTGALCGTLYVKLAPRRGMAFGMSERYFSLRNAFYRNKRRQAAKKFEVYMGKQGRSVSFDKDGKYVDPDEKKDPTDKRWMN
jgi:membrane associated rhomboid family serine protease